jgi:predicted alpha/beta superfamily hydrolase
MRQQASIILAVVLAFSAFEISAECIDTRLLQSFGEVRYHELKPEKLGRSFHIFVDLPEDYQSTDHKYPTIYLLDGGNTFPLMAAHHHYLRFGDETPEAILVGISYGADTFKEGNWRSTDYTAPSAERDFWGGAGVFQAVIKDELIPLIEAEYRSDPSRRILFGHSIGGQFVLYNALTMPALFYGHIASNPALHRNLPFFLEWHGQAEISGSVSRLFVASSEFDDPRFRQPTLQWVEHWQAVTPSPWTLEVRTLPAQTHLSSTPEAFRLGLAWLLPMPAPGG